MKRTLLTLALAMFFFGATYASNADLFTFDDEKVQQELSEATQLEAMLWNANDASLEDMNVTEFSNFEMADFAPNLSYEPPLGIPSFWWGFCFSATGILVVYLVTDSKDEAINALKGCAVNGLVLTGCYIIVAVVGSAGI